MEPSHSLVKAPNANQGANMTPSIRLSIAPKQQREELREFLDRKNPRNVWTAFFAACQVAADGGTDGFQTDDDLVEGAAAVPSLTTASTPSLEGFAKAEAAMRSPRNLKVETFFSDMELPEEEDNIELSGLEKMTRVEPSVWEGDTASEAESITNDFVDMLRQDWGKIGRNFDSTSLDIKNIFNGNKVFRSKMREALMALQNVVTDGGLQLQVLDGKLSTAGQAVDHHDMTLWEAVKAVHVATGSLDTKVQGFDSQLLGLETSISSQADEQSRLAMRCASAANKVSELSAEFEAFLLQHDRTLKKLKAMIKELAAKASRRGIRELPDVDEDRSLNVMDSESLRLPRVNLNDVLLRVSSLEAQGNSADRHSEDPDLAQRVKNLESMMGGNAHKLLGRSFGSACELELWAEENVIPSCGYFWDLFSCLVAMNQDKSQTGKARADTACSSARTNTSHAENKLISSMTHDWPACLFHSSDNTQMATKEEGFAACKDHKQWIGAQGRRGLRDVLRDQLRNCITGLKSTIDRATGNGLWKSEAKLLLDNVVNQFGKLCVFIDSFYQTLTDASKFSKARAWALVGRCVGAVFEVQLKDRSEVALLENTALLRDKTEVIGVVLKCHETMDDFIAAGFVSHPDMAKEITTFVLTERVDPKQVSDLEADVAALRSELAAAKSAIASNKDKQDTINKSLGDLKHNVASLKGDKKPRPKRRKQDGDDPDEQGRRWPRNSRRKEAKLSSWDRPTLRGLATGRKLVRHDKTLEPCVVFGRTFPSWLPILESVGCKPRLLMLTSSVQRDAVEALLPADCELWAHDNVTQCPVVDDSNLPRCAFSDTKLTGRHVALFERLQLLWVASTWSLPGMRKEWRERSVAVDHARVGGVTVSQHKITLIETTSTPPATILSPAGRVCWDANAILDATGWSRGSRKAPKQTRVDPISAANLGSEGSPIWHSGGLLPAQPRRGTCVLTPCLGLPKHTWGVRHLTLLEVLRALDHNEDAAKALQAFGCTLGNDLLTKLAPGKVLIEGFRCFQFAPGTIALGESRLGREHPNLPTLHNGGGEFFPNLNSRMESSDDSCGSFGAHELASDATLCRSNVAGKKGAHLCSIDMRGCESDEAADTTATTSWSGDDTAATSECSFEEESTDENTEGCIATSTDAALNDGSAHRAGGVFTESEPKDVVLKSDDSTEAGENSGDASPAMKFSTDPTRRDGTQLPIRKTKLPQTASDPNSRRDDDATRHKGVSSKVSEDGSELSHKRTLEEVDREHRERKATKSDDAEVPECLWLEHMINDFPDNVKESKVIRDVADEQRPALERLVKGLRSVALRWWKRHATRSFHEWLRKREALHVSAPLPPSVVQFSQGRCTWGPDGGKQRYQRWHVERSDLFQRDCDVARDATRRASLASWWGWDAGSTPFFWRWPQEHLERTRDGVPVCFKSHPPCNRKPQRPAKNADEREKIKAKLRKVRARGCITPGEVISLTNFFAVPKGEWDVRMVYDGTASGLNNCLWVPGFGLPAVSTHLRAVGPDTHMADIDIGEMFLNFMLHGKLQPHAGVDFTAFFGEEADGVLWEVWARCAMGLAPSPCLACQGMGFAEEVI